MGCGKSKPADVTGADTLSQTKRMNSELKKSIEAEAVPKETKDVVSGTAFEEALSLESPDAEEKKTEGSSELKDDYSVPEDIPVKDGEARVEPELELVPVEDVYVAENVVQEKRAEEETVKEVLEAPKEAKLIKEEAETAPPSFEVDQETDAKSKDEFQTSEKVAEADFAVSNPKTK